MSLTSTTPHALGRNRWVFAKAEVTPGTQIKPVAGDAVEIESDTMKDEVSLEPWLVPGQYRDPTEVIEGKGKVTFSMESWLLPSGTAATEPQASPILTAGFGANNSGAGSIWTYTPTAVQTVPTLSLYRGFEDAAGVLIYSEAIWGAVVDKITVRMSGGDPIMFSAEGWAQGMAKTGNSTLNGIMSASTTMVVQTVDKNQFQVGSLIEIGTTDNVLVTVDSAAPSFTVDTSVSEADTSVVKPWLPDPTPVAGSPLTSIKGSLDIHDGVSAQTVKVNAFEVSITNNVLPYEDVLFEQYPTDGSPDWRAIEGTLTFRMRKDYLIHLMNIKEVTARDLAIVCGDTAGKRWKVDMDYCMLNFSEATVPKDQVGTVTASFRALGSSGNDSITLTHD